MLHNRIMTPNIQEYLPLKKTDHTAFKNPCDPGLYCLLKLMYPNTSESPGPGCSKLTTSLVNVSLKFQTLISEISQYFLLKKCEKLLH